MCFQSVYPSSPETWTQPQQQSWCNQSNTIAHLSLPLHSLWENRNVKCPASAASGKNQSMFTNQIWNIGSKLPRSEGPTDRSPLSWRLQLFAAEQRLPFLLWMSVSSTPPPTCSSVLCTGDWALIYHRHHTKLFTPALFGNADSFFNC